MVKSIWLSLALSLTLSACTGSGSSTSKPHAANVDSADYARMKTEKDWNNYLETKESDLRAACGSGSYYSYIYECASDSASLGQLNFREKQLNRYVIAAKTARYSGKLSKGSLRSVDSTLETLARLEKRMQESFKTANARKASQDVIIAKLNQKTNCRVTHIDKDDSAELALSDCDPLKGGDYAVTVDLLNQLSLKSLSSDQNQLQTSIDRFSKFGSQVNELARVRQNLLDKSIVIENGASIQINGAGNPFGGMNDLDDVAAYSRMAQKLSTDLGTSDACPQPGCDRALFDVSAAVGASFLDAYCANHSSDTPSEDYLKTWRNLSSPETLKALSVNFNVSFLQLDSVVEDSVLKFPHVFSDQRILLTVDSWHKASACEGAPALFNIFQETDALIKYVGTIGTQNAHDVREIRFVVPSSYPGAVNAVRIDGGIRLEIPALEHALAGKTVAVNRALFYSQIPSALAGVAAAGTN